MSLETLVGHAAAAGRLAAAARNGELSHAVLITGPPSVGKTTLAVGLAEVLLEGDSWPGPPDTHPDLWLEDGSGERIGIDRIRAGAGEDQRRSLQDFLALRSYLDGPRVAVMARAERLTLEAANCMLRTVEEPPPRTHLILCAANPERLPDTVVSRCQSIGLAPAGRLEIQAWLAGRQQLEPALAEVCAAASQGRPGRALRLASSPGALEAEMSALDSFLEAAGGGSAGAIRAAGRLAPGSGAEGREQALMQLSVWSQFLRDAACVAAGAPELVVWSGYRPALDSWATLPLGRLVEMLERCTVAAAEVERYTNPRLCFDVLFLEIFARRPAPPALSGWRPPAPPLSAAAAPGRERGRRGAPRG